MKEIKKTILTLISATGLMYLVVGLLFTKKPMTNYFLFNILLIFSLNYLIIYIHELGHLVFGKLVKLDVLGIQVGTGNTLVQFNIFGSEITITKSVLGGVAFIGDIPERHTRLKLFFLYSGGVLMQAIIVIPFIVFYGFDMYSITSGYQISFVDSFIFANISIMIINLIPHKTKINREVTNSDGLHLLKILFSNKDYISQLITASKFNFGLYHFSKARDDIAYEALEKIKSIKEYKFASYNLLSAIHIMRNNTDEALKHLNVLAELPESENTRNIIYNNIAWCHILRGDKNSLNKAIDFLELAYEESKPSDYIKGTHATLSIELEEYEDGIEMFESYLQLKRRSSNIPINLIYYIFACSRIGNIEKANHAQMLLEKQKASIAPSDIALFIRLDSKTDYWTDKESFRKKIISES